MKIHTTLVICFAVIFFLISPTNPWFLVPGSFCALISFPLASKRYVVEKPKIRMGTHIPCDLLVVQCRHKVQYVSEQDWVCELREPFQILEVTQKACGHEMHLN